MGEVETNMLHHLLVQYEREYLTCLLESFYSVSKDYKYAMFCVDSYWWDSSGEKQLFLDLMNKAISLD